MSTLVKSTVLSLSLLAGVTAAAYAQSNNVAALPPGAAAPAAPAPVGPAAALPGPNPGAGWYGATPSTQATVTPSADAIEGPKPGQGWYGKEQQTQAVQPSESYPGPRPN